MRSGTSSELTPLDRALSVLKKRASYAEADDKAECPFATLGRTLGLANPHGDDDEVGATSSAIPVPHFPVAAATTLKRPMFFLESKHWAMLVRLT